MPNEKGKLMINEVWVVVADAYRARIFSTTRQNTPLSELKTMLHPESRLSVSELKSDNKGRTFDSSGLGHRHAIEPKIDAKTSNIIAFAHDLASELEQGRLAKKYKQLVIVAAPIFMGELRKQLSDGAAKLVCYEMSKELSEQKAEVIRQHLPAIFPPLLVT